MKKIEKLQSVEPYASNSYLIFSGNECAVVDPSCPFDESMLCGCKLKYILITHGHFDHFLYIDSWQESTGAIVVVSHKDRELMADPIGNCYKLFLNSDRSYHAEAREVCDGDELILGDVRIHVDEYPGHTAGSLAYTIEECVFSGDLIFNGGGYGRCDLPSGDMHALWRSVKRIISLDGAMVIMPGHGESFTINDYKKHLR